MLLIFKKPASARQSIGIPANFEENITEVNLLAHKWYEIEPPFFKAKFQKLRCVIHLSILK